MAKRATSQPPVLPGYSFIRPLGTGGFADVFLYEQDMPRRVVAVKVLLDDAINPEVLRAFNAEADIMARLSAHPAIVTIYQASIAADGRPYLVMEFCPDTLGARYRKGPLPVPEVLDAGVRIAAALETAHRSGLLHRDIKPSNLLVTTMGAPVLADFGISASLNRRGDEPEVFAMSVPWSSPEVLQEQVSGSVPSEVWSLGATLYTLLAGRSPFEVAERDRNRREQLTQRVVKARYQRIERADVPERLQSVLAQAMAKDPSQRFATMVEFAEALRWAQYELGIPPTPLEVASDHWAGASAPIDFSDDRQRGPVITTVNEHSRRAVRVQQQIDDRSARMAASPRRSGGSGAWKPALLGAGIATVVLGGAVFGLLVSGVL